MSFKFLNGLNLSSQKIVSLADPTSAQDAATKLYVDRVQPGGIAASTTAIGTSITAVTGLSATIPSGGGSYAVYMYVPIVTVGTGMTLTANISPSSGPTTTSVYIAVNRAQVTGNRVYTGNATAFNTDITVATGLGAGTFLVEIMASVTATSNGTISLSMTRTSGTSITTQIGSYIKLERLV